MNSLDSQKSAALSRRMLLRATGTAGLGLALTPLVSAQPGGAQAQGVATPMAEPSDVVEIELIQDILNITSTTESFGVTVLGEAINSAAQGNFDRPIPDAVLAVLVAARAQEQFHLEFFQSLGGELLTDTFTVPPELLTDYDLFFSTLVELEAREIAAQIAAMRTFAALKRPDLAKVSFQYAAEEAEHRLLANYALGTRPANDVAFAPALYTRIAEHLAFLEESGIVGGNGTEIVYPGPGAIDASTVIEPVPGGPLIACAPAAGGAGR
ncbi:MAG: ferritin-like domain-containing protein [Chloroflexi bacterium]|nr:ferritin-like domain-containing protein [Chloroflexota bacterium]